MWWVESQYSLKAISRSVCHFAGFFSVSGRSISSSQQSICPQGCPVPTSRPSFGRLNYTCDPTSRQYYKDEVSLRCWSHLWPVLQAVFSGELPRALFKIPCSFWLRASRHLHQYRHKDLSHNCWQSSAGPDSVYAHSSALFLQSHLTVQSRSQAAARPLQQGLLEMVFHS